MSDIKKVAVIGAGVMGAGIAAQVANAETEVLLLDIVPDGANDRDTVAKGALAKLKKSKPAAFMHKKNAKFMSVGNIEDNLKDIKDCDWIIEAVIENIDIKKDLYKKIEKHRKKTAVVSSNTSTLPLEMLTEDASKSFKEHFFITHFFNPPRYMRLMEIVKSKNVKEANIQKVTDFIDHKMGKSLVDCNDTPGFIANRIGTFWIHAAVTKAMEHGVDVESADAVLGRPTGVPKTGVFGLVDLVGLDLMPHIFDSFQKSLKKDDPFIQLGDAPKLLEKMIEDGYTGRKGKGGFYRLNTEGGKKVKEAISLQDGSYSKAKRPKVDAAEAAKSGGLRATVAHDSKEGQYAWDVLSRTFCYAASLVGEIADDIELIDRAMRLGYNWKYGPFELIDKIGVENFVSRLEKEDREVPAFLKTAKGQKLYRTQNGQLQFLNTKGAYEDVKRPQGVLLLEDIKRRSQPVYAKNFRIPFVGANLGANLWDIGSGVLCLEFNSKMNAMDPLIMSVMNKGVELINNKEYKGMVIYNEAQNFCVGANLGLVTMATKVKLWPLVKWFIRKGQKTFMNMKYANAPIVGAPSGMALGGGCEVLLHCHALTAHAETYTGLVEAGVGLVPAWGGCKELVGREAHKKGQTNTGPMAGPLKAFEAIATAQVATSAKEARDMNILRDGDDVIMNRDRVLQSAKDKVLELAKDFKNPEPFVYRPAGHSGAAAMKLGVDDFALKGVATPHDVTIAGKLAHILSGGDHDMTEEIDEEEMLKLELEGILWLSKTKKTQARIMHMLTKGKPLRN